MTCNACNGSGWKLARDPREWQPENVLCGSCDGTGRADGRSLRLPPLPTPSVAKGCFPSVPGDPADQDYFTAQQMRQAQYGAVQAELDRQPRGLDADDIRNMKDALSWMGESTPESLEECEIDRFRLMRRLIRAVLTSRDRAHEEVQKPEPATPALTSPVKDHDIREAVNQLRDVAIQYHHTGQLRSRIQEVVLPLMARCGAGGNGVPR